MQKQKLYKAIKTIAMLLGFPLMSLVLLCTSYPLMQEEFAGDFARNWLIVTVVIWVVIEIARYIAVSQTKTKSDTTRRVVNISMIFISVLAIVLPTSIYGAVVKSDYEAAQLALEKSGTSIDDFDRLTGWVNGVTDKDSNALITLKKDVNKFISDYDLDEFATTKTDNKKDLEAGYDYFPGVMDTIKDELAKKAAAEAELEQLKAELATAEANGDQAKIDELTKAPINIKLNIGTLSIEDLRVELARMMKITPEIRKALYGDVPMPEGFEFPSYTDVFSDLNGVLKVVFGETADAIELGNIEQIVDFLADTLGFEALKDLDVEFALEYIVDIVFGIVTNPEDGGFIDQILSSLVGTEISGMGGTIYSLIAPQLEHTDNKLAIIVTLINELYDPQSSVCQQLVPMLGWMGIVLPVSIDVNAEIAIPVGNSVIKAKEAEINSGWSDAQLIQMRAKLNNYPQVLAYGNFMHIAYIFAGVVGLMMMIRFFIEEKEAEARKKNDLEEEEQ